MVSVGIDLGSRTIELIVVEGGEVIESKQKHRYYLAEPPWMDPGNYRGSGGVEPKPRIRNYRKYQF